jgi:DNA replication protein DnaC
MIMAENEKETAFAEIMDRLAKELMPPEEQPMVTAKAVETTAKAMISKGYEITSRTLEVLTDYLKGYNIWLCGNVGTGKTYFFETMSRVRADKGLDPIRKLSMIETMGWTMDQAREWLDDSEGFDIVIDDVGTEPEMNNYGVRAELFPYILERRMGVWRRRTHMTSNLGPADILKRYDRRVADRFTEMFKLEKLESKKSRRHLSPWKKATAGGLL